MTTKLKTREQIIAWHGPVAGSIIARATAHERHLARVAATEAAAKAYAKACGWPSKGGPILALLLDLNRWGGPANAGGQDGKSARLLSGLGSGSWTSGDADAYRAAAWDAYNTAGVGFLHPESRIWILTFRDQYRKAKIALVWDGGESSTARTTIEFEVTSLPHEWARSLLIRCILCAAEETRGKWDFDVGRKTDVHEGCTAREFGELLELVDTHAKTVESERAKQFEALRARDACITALDWLAKFPTLREAWFACSDIIWLEWAVKEFLPTEADKLSLAGTPDDIRERIDFDALLRNFNEYAAKPRW